MTEADLKRAVEDYLTIQQNARKLMFLRLNSGDFFIAKSEESAFRRRVKGCPKGTSDYIIIRGMCGTNFSFAAVYFIELKSETGKLSPEQKQFRNLAESHGTQYLVIRDLDTLRGIVEQP
jgi:hypothetical protein